VSIKSIASLAEEIDAVDQANRANSQSNSSLCLQQSGRGTILCPAWNPLVIVLDTNGDDTTPFLFRNPFVLMRAVQSMADTEFRQLLIENTNNLHKSREQGQSQLPVYFGVVLGPQADIGASMQQIAMALHLNQRSIITQADVKIEAEWIQIQDVTSLCEILQSLDSTSHQPPEGAVLGREPFSIFNITHTIPWMRVVSQIEKTNSAGIRFICP
jgi:hypothetical protein